MAALTKYEILSLADKVTADFEGYSYLRHGEEDWLIQFVKEIEAKTREEDARICESLDCVLNQAQVITDRCAAAIRKTMEEIRIQEAQCYKNVSEPLFGGNVGVAAAIRSQFNQGETK